MLFNSIAFVYLLVTTLVLFYSLKSWQTMILVIASFVFYAFNSPKLLALLIVSVLINIVVSHQVVHSKGDKKLVATVGVILNLLILIFFKYSPLIGGTFFPEASSIGEFLVQIPLPIGISFFTFQGISLVIDTYKGSQVENYESLVPKSLLKHSIDTTLFISFFPQLVAGPIVKSKDFIPQIKTKTLTDINRLKCFKDIVTGYFLKMVVADNLSDFTLYMVYPYFETKSGLDLLVMLFGYSMQIFADFAGYSLIAIGIAGLFGYSLRDNFMFPYISTSFSEFWRRWHMSLSSFLKEYLYFPLGGNRKGKTRTYVNLFLTMLLGGLWHGAAWSYAVWGAYHGIALGIERLFKDKYGTITTGYLKFMKGVFVFLVVTFGWLLFRLPEFSHVISYLKSIVTNFGYELSLTDIRNMVLIMLYSLPVILYHLYYRFKEKYPQSTIANFEYLAYGAMMFLIFTNSGSAEGFIYFQF